MTYSSAGSTMCWRLRIFPLTGHNAERMLGSGRAAGRSECGNGDMGFVEAVFLGLLLLYMATKGPRRL